MNSINDTQGQTIPPRQPTSRSDLEHGAEGELVVHLPENQTEYCRIVARQSHDPRKKDLPMSRDFVSPVRWLKAIQACVGEEIVFALDEALMCLNLFGGRYNEWGIWAYGPESLRQYDGITLLGNTIDPSQVEHSRGLSFTTFNRTLKDALVFEPILDMQGITEGLSAYYFTHNETIEGISVPTEYQTLFISLLQDAMEYYDS